MKTKIKIALTAVILIATIALSASILTAAQTFSGVGNTPSYVTSSARADIHRYYSAEQLSTYYPILASKDTCEGTQDLIIQVVPAGCQPAVVRSDLLAEQNVPVFCQLSALKANPLVDITKIKNIRFGANYPKEVVGVGFHPAQAALRTQDSLLGSPLTNNIGYIVVVLKKNPQEKTLPKLVNFTLSAKVEYDAENILGAGRAEFLLTPQTDEQFASSSSKQSFFNGQYFLRLEEVTPNYALVSIYSGDKKLSTTKINRGQTSQEIYIPGSYCRVAIALAFDGFVPADKLITLRVNDDVLELAEGSKFLNNKCSVKKINQETPLAGTVDLVCGSQTLKLALGTIILSKDTDVKYPADQNQVYKITNVDYVNNQYEIQKVKNDKSLETETKKVKFTDVTPADAKSMPADEPLSENVQEYFNKAIEKYKEVADNFPFEKDPQDLEIAGTEPYGKQALKQAIDLSLDFNQKQKAAELLAKYRELYTEQLDIAYFDYQSQGLLSKDTTNANAVLDMDNSIKTIELKSFNEPPEKSKAKLSFGRQEIEIALKDSKEQDSLKLTLDKLTFEEATLTAYCKEGETYKPQKSFTLKLNGEGESLCGNVLTLTDISIKDLAKIRVIPSIRTSGETNFTVGIGIEKRAIQLSPEKTKERINSLNKTIKQWESISSGLGNLVSGLKTACFATSAILTIKNFFTGLSGEALARQKVMRSPGGWTETCTKAASNGEYQGSINNCYSANSNKIAADISAEKEAIKSTNEKIEAIEKNHVVSQGGIFGSDAIDRDKSALDLLAQIQKDYPNVEIGKTADSKSVTTSSLDAKSTSYEQLRDIYTNLQLKKSSSTGLVAGLAAKNLNAIAGDVAQRQNYLQQSQQAQNLVSFGLPPATDASSIIQGSTLSAKVNKLSSPQDKYIKGDDQTHIATVTLPAVSNNPEFNNPGTYALGLAEIPNGKYAIKSIVKIDPADGRILDNDISPQNFFNEYKFSIIIPESKLSYQNQIKNLDKSCVQYYETEPYKGMPAIVPFDTQNGWYVATKQTLPSFGGIKAFESSGRPVSFWICNVMEDGQIGFFQSGFGGDQCRQFNLNTGQPLDKFPGQTETQTTRLVDQAVDALNRASEQHGKKQVLINGKAICVGEPAANLPGTQCQDFMSPGECKLLFNVCDPVICPSSRCDFGGSYPVADVVQTGIVGSALLCLPNFKEGIIMPVCLTGIKAGIDGLISILKSYQACLQENLKTGQTIGICDEITSIYMCEFFWRQAAPIANILLPKLFEIITGQTAPRGGGEYLTVSSAWKNAQGSANYFTQSYAANSIKAFQARSIEEAGTQVCRAWISIAGPSSFKTLVEPDSPPQFHAWFSTTSFSDATVPATAQYKVFYHIFAGNDAGIAYSVYLTEPPETSYYATTPTIQVASGFIAKGQYATETKDFTAPEGYQKLCVRINDKDECGFKQVSTSFAINYLRDQYVSGELNRTDITSESDCISGSPNIGSLLQPNIQAGAEEAAIPQVYNRGVIRICSTANPGKGTEEARFQEVGYCDDQKVKCWLDKNSVDNALSSNIPKTAGIKNQTLSELQKSEITLLKERGEIYVGSDASTQIDKFTEEAEQVINKGNTIDKDKLATLESSSNILSDKLYFNYDKARLLLKQAMLYRRIAATLKFNEPSTPRIQTPSAQTPESTETETPENIYKVGKDGYIFLDNKNLNIQIRGDKIYAQDKLVGNYNLATQKITIENEKVKKILDELSSTTITYLANIDQATVEDGKLELVNS